MTTSRSTPSTAAEFRSATADRPFLYIAVGVLADADGRVLIAKRRPGKPGAGKWEFPGGKREPGEDVPTALARELDEELGVRVTAARPLIRFSHDYSDRRVLLDIWRVDAWAGEPHGREGQQLAWCPPSRLFDYDLLAANGPVVTALRLPSTYAITPEPDGDRERFLRRVRKTADAGAGLLRLRAWSLDDDAYETLAQDVRQRLQGSGTGLLLDRDPAMVERLGADGLHWPARSLATLRRRPVGREHWFAVSCHDRAELEHALAAEADFATLSPVAATPGHPQTTPLEWPGFSRLCEGLALPVYALGGVAAADLEQAWAAGAQGIAGIRGFWREAETR